MAERHPSRTILLVPDPDSGDEPHRRDGLARVLRDPGRRAQRLLGGDRAAAARHAREGAGVDRRAAADLRPAGVPALARRAAVGRRRSSSSSSTLTDRLIVDSTEWDDLPYPYRQLVAALRPHRGLRHRVGAHVALAHAARVALARTSPTSRTIRVRGTAAQAQLLAGWLRSRLGRDDIALEHVDGRAPRGHRPRRRAGAVPARRPAAAERRALGRARPLHPRPRSTRPRCARRRRRKESGALVRRTRGCSTSSRRCTAPGCRSSGASRPRSPATGSSAATRCRRRSRSAVRKRRSFRGAGSLEAWVWRIVVNAARDARRRRPVARRAARRRGERARAGAAARPADRAAARDRLSPLLRRPRLRGDRGTRSRSARARSARRSPPRGRRCAAHSRRCRHERAARRARAAVRRATATGTTCCAAPAGGRAGRRSLVAAVVRRSRRSSSAPALGVLLTRHAAAAAAERGRPEQRRRDHAAASPAASSSQAAPWKGHDGICYLVLFESRRPACRARRAGRMVLTPPLAGYTFDPRVVAGTAVTFAGKHVPLRWCTSRSST